MEKEDLHTLRIMGIVSRAGDLSQRELANRLNISLGLVNTFIKRLVKKGHFKVSTMPSNRVKYFLTPAGLARKSRLTVEYLKYSVDSYKEIKTLLLKKYRDMEEDDVKSLLFYGAGEVAELAYLYLQLTDIRLTGIIDNKKNGKKFFRHRITGLDSINAMEWDLILLTSLDTTDQDIEMLVESGIEPERIALI